MSGKRVSVTTGGSPDKRIWDLTPSGSAESRGGRYKTEVWGAQRLCESNKGMECGSWGSPVVSCGTAGSEPLGGTG
jgi:hypothetical protein